MKTLKEYTDLQKLTGDTDIDIIKAYFIDNDMEEEFMDISHALAKAKIDKLRARKHIIKEWAYTIPSDYLYEKYPVKTATMLHRIELDYIVNGAVTGPRLDWARLHFPKLKEPGVYFQPCVRWLLEHGIEFGESPFQTPEDAIETLEKDVIPRWVAD